jgi:hypothetical protein
VKIGPTKTTDHKPSNKQQIQPSSHAETIIGDHTFRWPNFEIHNVFFKGNLIKNQLNI